MSAIDGPILGLWLDELEDSKVALQFSGGKDSTALLYLMKPYWDKLRVYWLDSGDVFPETKEFVETVAKELPCFITVQGKVREVITNFGIPSDVVPFDNSPMGPGELKLQNRGECCARSKMIPMHQRMHRDGIEVIFRGQKNSDRYRGPLVDGQVMDGIKFHYPIQNWTDEQVFQYLEKIDRVPPLYGYGMERSGDCMTCSAWLEPEKAQYLAWYHPQDAATLAVRLGHIAQAIAPVVKTIANCKEILREEQPLPNPPHGS